MILFITGKYHTKKQYKTRHLQVFIRAGKIRAVTQAKIRQKNDNGDDFSR